MNNISFRVLGCFTIEFLSIHVINIFQCGFIIGYFGLLQLGNHSSDLTFSYIRIPTVKLKIPGKKHVKSRIPNFCYIQNIVFDLAIYLVGYLPWLSTSGSGWDEASPEP